CDRGGVTGRPLPAGRQGWRPPPGDRDRGAEGIRPSPALPDTGLCLFKSPRQPQEAVQGFLSRHARSPARLRPGRRAPPPGSRPVSPGRRLQSSGAGDPSRGRSSTKYRDKITSLLVLASPLFVYPRVAFALRPTVLWHRTSSVECAGGLPWLERSNTSSSDMPTAPLICSETVSRVSSVLHRDAKQFGKKHMFDTSEETCWNSDQGSSQWVMLEFPQTVKVSQLQIQFQGGFASQLCTLEGGRKGEELVKISDFYPEDINALQASGQRNNAG
ncbi:nuclear receptor 2C2 associated protein, partial [Chelydra serpentina]